MALHAALLSSHIRAIANFGGMWMYFEPACDVADYQGFEGINCFSQLIPGAWRLGDQKRFVLAAAPIRMLAGYGKQEGPSYLRFLPYYEQPLKAQYAELEVEDHLEWLVHEEDHTFPAEAVLDYFTRELAADGE